MAARKCAKVPSVKENSQENHDNTEAREALVRRASHLEALNYVIAAATSAVDMQAVIDVALDRTLEALGLKTGVIVADQYVAGRGLANTIGASIHPLMAQAQIPSALPVPLVVADWQQVPDDHPWARMGPLMLAAGARASLAVGIVVGGRQSGMLALVADRPRIWSPDETDLVAAIGRQLSVGLERLHVLASAQAHDYLMTRLAAASEKLNRSLTEEQAAAAIGAGALELSGAQRAALFALDNEAQASCLWATGLDQAHLSQMAGSIREVYAALGAEGVQSPRLQTAILLVPDASRRRVAADQAGYREFGVWPLTYEGQLLALMACFYDLPHRWSDTEEDVLQAFARQGAAALANTYLYASLQESNARLQAAIQARDEIIQNVSHDLRVPLTNIRGYAEAFLAGMLGELTDDQREAASIMLQKTETLTRLIHGLLTLETLAPHDLNIEPLDPELFLMSLAQDWQPQAIGQGVDVTVEPVMVTQLVLADAERMRQVCDQLLENAFKYTPSGGQVALAAQACQRAVRLAISDTGTGVPAGELERIFERFYRGERGTRRRSGSGIGLAVVRKIVQAHGGRVWAESPGWLGSGTSFVIELPASE
jgi:signal transduction histidine kinase